jgi:hypothetical protein
LQGTSNGIGTALRDARESLGKTVEEASRDTRIKAEYLHALESETFHALRGDVYVRGFLRSYSSYLGLDADRVVTDYTRSSGPDPSEPLPSPLPPPVQHRGLRVLHRTGNWKLATGLAIVLLVVFGAVGLLSASRPSPSADTVAPSTGVPAAVATESVVVSMVAAEPVRGLVVVDGVTMHTGPFPVGKPFMFTGHSLIRIELPHGDAAQIAVDGHDLGTPGSTRAPYTASFAPGDFRSTPSANAT